jgi:hypothetical protein
MLKIVDRLYDKYPKIANIIKECYFGLVIILSNKAKNPSLGKLVVKKVDNKLHEILVKVIFLLFKCLKI